MIGILQAKFKSFIRNPWTFVTFTGMSLIFALIFGGAGVDKAFIPVYSSDETIKDSYIGKQLVKQDAFQFSWMSEEQLLEKIEKGNAENGVILHEDDFEIIVGVDSFNTELVNEMISSVYQDKAERERIVELANQNNKDSDFILAKLDTALENPIFDVQTATFRGEGAFVYDNSLHRVFGFSLFFVIYTIAYNVLPILVEKKEGIWDRMILSPLKKWEMYIANLLYSFFMGYVQVLVIFLTFRYIIGVNFHGAFFETLLLLIPYVFAIVSLAILITALVKKVQQFNAVLPIVSVSMAMIGGAYWPIEIVESEALLALSKINPLTYGMEILTGSAVYGYSLPELLVPISILILMGVVLMGLGIHLMERRHI
ncbi:ABC transporter permease [Ornithinibacillus scapharcae]|uniref:ABC transporter permease n=1 Tax=Ornithinibacillus scapharcae TaxID=1147159 RepID=UPI000225AD46|nr:ABC transporter permease [Ornithinibacillus scapharcae]